MSNTRRKNRPIISFLILALMIICSTMPVSAASSDSEMDSAGNYFFSGDSLNVNGGLFFGGYGAGRDLTINNSESQDSVALSGMNLEVSDSKIGGSAYLAGNSIKISKSTLKGNIFAAGNLISVDSQTTGNSLMAAGNHVSFAGNTKAVKIYADTVTFDGKVDGDVFIEAGSVELGENAEITGALKVRSEEEPVIAKSAKVKNLEYEQTNIEDEDDRDDEIADEVKSALYWSVAMGILGLLIYAFGRRSLEQAAVHTREHPGKTFGFGALAMILIPIVSVICLITFVGIPAGLVGIIGYLLIFAVSQAFAGASLGLFLRKGILRKVPGFLMVVIGVIILEFAKRLPYAGIVIFFAAALYAFGYAVFVVFGREKSDEDIITEAEA